MSAIGVSQRVLRDPKSGSGDGIVPRARGEFVVCPAPGKSLRAERVRRVPASIRWLVSAAALALMPKCLLCAAAYLGLGAALGLGTPELCGGSRPGPTPWTWAASAGALAVSFVVLPWLHRRMVRSRTPQRAVGEPGLK